MNWAWGTEVGVYQDPGASSLSPLSFLAHFPVSCVSVSGSIWLALLYLSAEKGVTVLGPSLAGKPGC